MSFINTLRELVEFNELENFLNQYEQLVEDAKAVVANWEDGNLARAVHDLQITLEGLDDD